MPPEGSLDNSQGDAVPWIGAGDQSAPERLAEIEAATNGGGQKHKSNYLTIGNLHFFGPSLASPPNMLLMAAAGPENKFKNLISRFPISVLSSHRITV